MKLLFLTETIPFPLDSGGRIKTYHTLGILSQEHDIHCHTFIREERQREFERDLVGHCRSLTLHLRRRSWPLEARSLAAAYTSGLPFLVQRHFDRGVLEQLKSACSQISFDAVYCDHLSMVEYGRRLGLPLICDAHNVEFEIVKRHAATLGGSPLRILAELEWRALRRYERSIYPHCRLIYSVSDIDAQSIRALSGENVPVAAVPIPVDTKAVAVAMEPRRTRELLFVGGLHWPPNADAVVFFIERILPLIRAAVPDVRLTVVGRSYESVRGRLRSSESVTFVGHVVDVEPYFRRCRAMVVPLRSGSGMRVKILDALARGIPTVTTTVGCEGIDAESGRHLLIADTPAAFADSVVRLLTDNGLSGMISAEARTLAQTKYDVSVVGRQTLTTLTRVWRLCPSPGLSSRS
jgi:polysaccharide biosynthesis protein PslH